ncbi:hypothetical protein D3C87_2108130 [compost metagenome]
MVILLAKRPAEGFDWRLRLARATPGLAKRGIQRGCFRLELGGGGRRPVRGCGQIVEVGRSAGSL